ncbi:unnamed protein product [Adineta steineri]|uniref:SecA family profile domain-containing protein n=1 Tax=Adineta steineri TaxID=433720 RepID=A0A815N3J0_9BILA|nr:unnamed protein product [Adineta steineri]CAF1428763.1 unnamed protein product [Adineta steineri]
MMAESKESYKDHSQNIDINALLLNGLDGLKRNLSEDHSKIIYALQAVDGDEDGELKNRVIEASKTTKDAHIALIPYKKGSVHWAGIFIKFKPQMQIETMKVIDSAEKSNIDINSLQIEIDDIFNDVCVRWENVEKHSDPVKSAEVTVENLLRTAAEAIDISEQYMVIMGSHEQPHNNDESTSASPKDDYKSSASSVSINRSSKHHLLKQISESEIEPTIIQEKSSTSPLTYEKNQSTSESRKSSANTNLEERQAAHEPTAFKRPNQIAEYECRTNDEESKHHVTEESVINLYHDFTSIPPCAERFTINLLYLVSLKFIDIEKLSKANIVIPDDMEIAMLEQLNCLNKRLADEDLPSKSIQNLVETCRISIEDKNWKAALTKLKELFQKLSPLNMQELFRLVQKADEAAHLIQGKDIILFLGETGAGKSTAIHFFAGSTMKRVKVNGLNHISPTNIKNSELQRVTTSPFARSETRYITSVEVNYRSVGASTNGSIILCDTPGFEDTNGAEVDISNGIGVVKAVKECRTVKPLVLFSYKSIGDRCSGIKQLVHVIVGLIPDIKDHIQAFSYIFTKFPEEEKKTIHAMLQDVNDELNAEEKANVSFTCFLKDMLRKTRKSSVVLDPINDEPGDILDDLADTASIDRPHEAFQYFTAEKSKATIQEQVRKHQISIMSAIKRYEYVFVEYKLDQLNRLYQLLEQDDIKQVYDDCIRYISKLLNEEYQNSVLTFNRCLTNQTVINIEDIERYLTALHHAKLADKLKEKYLVGQEVFHSQAYIENLIDRVDIIMKDLKPEDLDKLSTKISLNKIKTFAKYFEEIKDKYKDACQIFANEYDRIFKSFESLLKENNMIEIANSLTKLSDACTILEDHLNKELLKRKYNELKLGFLQNFRDLIKKFSKDTSKEMYNDVIIENLMQCLHLFETVRKATDLQRHIDQKDIDSLYGGFIKEILEHYNQTNEKIMTELSNERSYSKIKILFEEITLIRKTPPVETETNKEYYKTLEHICGCIRDLRRDIELILNGFDLNRQISYSALMKCISSLKSAQWIENYRTDVYSDVLDNTKQHIIQHVKNLQKVIVQNDIDLDNSSNVAFISVKAFEINEMKAVEEIVPDIVHTIETVNDYFKNQIGSILSDLKATFNIDSWKQKTSQLIDFNEAEKGFKFLNECKSINIMFGIDSASVLSTLKNFIREYSIIIHEEIKDSFKFIKEFQNGDKQEICKKATLLFERLEELSDITNKYPTVLQYLQNRRIKDECKRDLEKYAADLPGELNFLNSEENTEAFHNKLLIAKALSTVDSFIQGKKYNEIYSTYQRVFIDAAGERGKRVIENINNFKYEEIQIDLETLRTSKEAGQGQRCFEQAKRVFNISLYSLLEATKTQTIMLGSKLETDAIKALVDNLKRIGNAKRYMSEYTDKSDLIDSCVQEVKGLIEGRMKNYLSSVRAVNNMGNFYEAGERLKHIQTVKDLLGIYCTQPISQEIDTLNDNQDEILDNVVVKRYIEKDISEYTLNPPKDIFDRLEKVKETDERYVKALGDLRIGIMSKFRKELDDAIKKKPPNPDNIHIRRFEAAIKHLPDDLQKSLKVEFKHCKEQITKDIQQNDKELDGICNSKDIKRMKELIEKYRAVDGMMSYVDKVQEYVRQQTEEIISIMKENLKEYKIKEALSSVVKFDSYRTELGQVLDIEPLCMKIRLEIANTFQEVYVNCMKYFSKEEKNSLDEEKIEVPTNDICCVLEFIKFRDRHKTKSILENMFPNDFDKSLNNFSETFIKLFNECEKNYKIASTNNDFTLYENVLSIVTKWNSSLIKIKNERHESDKEDNLMLNMVTCVMNLTLSSLMLDTISKYIKKLTCEIIQTRIINDDINEIEKDRAQRFKNLNKKFSILIDAKKVSHFFFDIDMNKFESECLTGFGKSITETFSLIEAILKRVFGENRFSNIDSIDFNKYYYNLVSFKQEMTLAPCGVKEKLEKIQQTVNENIESWACSIETNQTIQNVCSVLINMKRVAMNMSAFKEKIDARIDELLSNYKRFANDNLAISKIGTILNQDSMGIGQHIIREHKIFEGYSTSLFNEKTQRHDINYVLANLDGDLINKDLLRKRFEEYHQVYQQLIKKYLKPDMKLEPLVSDIKLIIGINKQHSDNIEWDTNKGKIPKLTAHIFALWTLKSAEHYFDAKGSDNQDSYLLQPHAAQIIAIFRMLGIGDKKEDLNNNLVQIGTGEGKSITLGATASILALFGFDIYCACYSQYLSERDYKSFRSLFDSLGVLNYIHYGTFNELCEEIINEDGQIRQVVEQIVFQNLSSIPKISKANKRAKILLIDEVDIFFSREFYGNLYTPVASLRDPTITALVYLIWSQRNSNMNFGQVEKTTEYKACVDRYPNWKKLVDEAVKDMLFDVRNFQSHDYTVKNGQIAYIEQDNVVYNVSYGYKTLFAYLHEHEKSNEINKATVEKNISIEIKCGSFSYAEIPLEFSYMMGVTGTLKTLSEPEKKVIRNVYKIKRDTYMPSVFGANDLKFNQRDDIKIENENDYFNVIKQEIEDRLCGISSGQRAVLVFFESEKRLNDFRDSQALTLLKDHVFCLTEQASLQEKESRIKSATVSGRITLFTRTFGRGTDFICYDQTVLLNGGTHVIQTFLSEEISEEVQIKGRTGRQGNRGSYSMVLLDRELEKFQIEKIDIEDIRAGKGILSRLADAVGLTKNYSTIYELLDEKRTEIFKARYDNNRKFVDHARIKHKEAKNFLLNLTNGNIEAVKAFLAEENKGAAGSSKSRTVCLMDATGSMSSLLHKCKNTLDIMFERASAILRENNILSDSFQLQLAVYRNYNSTEEKILQFSPWETKPDNLRTFMNTIEVDGGWGDEAVEIGLWHANQESKREPITQVILIGDAPPNSQNDVKSKRSQYGEEYWSGTKFQQQTYYEKELENLKLSNIPVHAFYVEKRAKSVFEKIAKNTGGRCENLDINSPAGAKMLTDLVTEEILKNVGGSLKGDILVKAYREKYSKTDAQ